LPADDEHTPSRAPELRREAEQPYKAAAAARSSSTKPTRRRFHWS